MRRIFLLILMLVMFQPLFGWHALPDVLFPGSTGSRLTIENRISSISVKEYVRDHGTSDGSEYILSRLDWELKQVLSTTIAYSAGLNDHLVFSLGGTTGRLASSGTMDDYDWIKTNPSGTALLYNGVLSHYSHHNNKLKVFGAVDLNLFYHSGKRTRFFAGGGFMYRVISMDGVDGYLQYTDETDPLTTPDSVAPVPITGKGISYTHHSFFPYAGIGLRQVIAPQLSLSGFALVSPLTWAVGVDNHWMRGLKFTDYLEVDLYCFFTIRLGFALTDFVSITLGWEMVYQPRAEGNTKVEDGVSTDVYADTGGGAFFSQSFLLGVSFRL